MSTHVPLKDIEIAWRIGKAGKKIGYVDEISSQDALRQEGE